MLGTYSLLAVISIGQVCRFSLHSNTTAAPSTDEEFSKKCCWAVCGGGILWILVLPVRFIPSLFYTADINDSFPALIVICHREAKATFLRTPADIWAHDWLRLCYPHWLKRENLGFKRMALPLFFYWKASANEQRNSCWAGCPHTA